MMKTKLIFLMKMRMFQKAHVSYSDVADMLHVGKIAPFHLFYLILKNYKVSLK